MRTGTIKITASALALTAAATSAWAQATPNATPAPPETTIVAPVAAQAGPTAQPMPSASRPVIADNGRIVAVYGQAGQATGWRTYKRLNALLRPVDVHLKDASIRQTAETLNKVLNSDIRIIADDSVPRDLRLTVDAEGVPLRSVLEAIATEANLMIGRDGESIVIRTWPSLNVNGRRSYYKGQFAPWGDEWGGRPGANDDLTRSGYAPLSGGGFAGSVFGGTGGNRSGGTPDPRLYGGQGSALPTGRALGGPGKTIGGGQSGSTLPGGRALGGGDTDRTPDPRGSAQRGGDTTGGFPGGFSAEVGSLPDPPLVQADGSVVFSNPLTSGIGSRSSLFAMTALGDKLVIAERGFGSQGEPGVILTVYQWDSSRQALRQISSTFHRAGGAVSRRAGAYRGTSGSSRTNNQGGINPFRPGATPPTPGGFSDVTPDAPGGFFGGELPAPGGFFDVTPAAPGGFSGGGDAFPVPEVHIKSRSVRPEPAPEDDTTPAPVPLAPGTSSTPDPEEPGEPLFL